MADEHKAGDSPSTFLSGLPAWARTMIIAIMVLPMSFALSMRVMDVSPGPLVERAMDLWFQRMEATVNGSTDTIVAAIDARIMDVNTRIDSLTEALGTISTKVQTVEGRIVALEVWACDHSRVQGLRQDAPAFCGGEQGPPPQFIQGE